MQMRLAGIGPLLKLKLHNIKYMLAARLVHFIVSWAIVPISKPAWPQAGPNEKLSLQMGWEVSK